MFAERRRILESSLADMGRFPEEVRDPVILSQDESEKESLVEVEEMVSDRDGQLEANKRIVEEARRRYDNHITALVCRLTEKFR